MVNLKVNKLSLLKILKEDITFVPRILYKKIWDIYYQNNLAISYFFSKNSGAEKYIIDNEFRKLKYNFKQPKWEFDLIFYNNEFGEYKKFFPQKIKFSLLFEPTNSQALASFFYSHDGEINGIKINNSFSSFKIIFDNKLNIITYITFHKSFEDFNLFKKNFIYFNKMMSMAIEHELIHFIETKTTDLYKNVSVKNIGDKEFNMNYYYNLSQEFMPQTLTLYRDIITELKYNINYENIKILLSEMQPRYEFLEKINNNEKFRIIFHNIFDRLEKYRNFKRDYVKELKTIDFLFKIYR